TRAAVRTLEVEREIAELETKHAGEQLESLRGMQDYVAREELRAAERKVETGRLAVRRSRTQLERGEAEHASAIQRGSMGELVVEFDAVVVALTAEQGQWVAAGQNLLVVADQQPRRVNVLVDPKAASRIAVGDRVEVERLTGTRERVALPIVRIGAAVLDDAGLVEVSLDAGELSDALLGEAVRVFAPWHEDAWCTGT
ncbi:MAG TPA: HlyD family secretion protein, partial [Enhygromyxa sp.]|nr:HlyD family secretion protein [Enhygromyxa sp.]